MAIVAGCVVKQTNYHHQIHVHKRRYTYVHIPNTQHIASIFKTSAYVQLC